MPGESDLSRILSGFSVSTRPGTFVFAVTGPHTFAADDVDATVREAEGTTYVVRREVAEAAGLPTETPMVWLTVDVQTSLEGVGLTAAMSRALADAQVPCNVLAGFHHDHLLVPVDLADTARRVLSGLRTGA